MDHKRRTMRKFGALLQSSRQWFWSVVGFRLTAALMGQIRTHARSEWRKLVITEDENEGYRPSRSLETPYESFKRERLENGYGGESSRNALSPFVGEVSRGFQLRALPTWAKEIEPFLANQLSLHTRRAYETDLKQFFRFLEDKISLETLQGLAPEHIILFRKALEEGRLNGKIFEKATINRKLAVIKSFFSWLKLNRVVAENPAEPVKGFPQSQESALKGFSDEEVRKILEIPNRNSRSGALHLAILNTLFHLGLRKGELIGLKMGDLDSERGIPVVKVRGKGHRIRILPITPLIHAVLEHYFLVCRRNREDKEAPLFIPTKNPRTKTIEKMLNPHAITYIVVRYAKKAGVLKSVSPHSCRATCISHALDKKASHRSVQHLAGWSTPLMIQRYDKRREDLQNSAAFLVDYGEDLASTQSSGIGN